MKMIGINTSSVLMCLFEAVVGVLLFVNPIAFTSGIIIAFGVMLMGLGLIQILQYFRTDPIEAVREQSLTKGLIALLLGGFCAFNSDWFIATFPILTLLYGVVILLTGIAKIQRMVDLLRMKKQRWYVAAISALISIACGLVIISKPFSSMALLWTFTGVSLIVEAVLDTVALILENKKKAPAVNSEETELAVIEGEIVDD